MSDGGYERRDIPAAGAALALAGILAGLVLVGLIVAAVLGWIGSSEPPSAPLALPTPPSPRLQVKPQSERLRIEAAGRARLKGDARHPSIEQAMRLIAAEGWGDRRRAPTVAETARRNAGAAQ